MREGCCGETCASGGGIWGRGKGRGRMGGEKRATDRPMIRGRRARVGPPRSVVCAACGVVIMSEEKRNGAGDGGGEKPRRRRKVSKDIAPILKGWDYESGTINVRK